MHKINWPGSVAAAKKEQQILADKVSLKTLDASIKLIAGIDVAFPEKGKLTRAAVVVLSYPDLQVIEQSVVSIPTELPYIPGVLSYREGNAVLQALAQLRVVPDLLMFDGQGILHPQRLGIASHIGVILNRPTMGVAKAPFNGIYKEPMQSQGSYESVYLQDEEVAVALRSKQNIKPIFVSPGHLITLQQALEITVMCCRGYKLPEPTRLADKLSRYQPS